MARDFNCWLAAECVETFDALRDLVILEQFKISCPRESLNISITEAAVLADGFVLTHKGKLCKYPACHTFDRREYRSNHGNVSSLVKSDPPAKKQTRNSELVGERFHNCLEVGHWKRDCPELVARNKVKNANSEPVICTSFVGHADSALLSMDQSSSLKALFSLMQVRIKILKQCLINV